MKKAVRKVYIGTLVVILNKQGEINQKPKYRLVRSTQSLAHLDVIETLKI